MLAEVLSSELVNLGCFSKFANLTFAILSWFTFIKKYVLFLCLILTYRFHSSTCFNQLYQPEEVEEVKEVVETEEDKMKEYHTAAKRLETTRVVGAPLLKLLMF